MNKFFYMFVYILRPVVEFMEDGFFREKPVCDKNGGTVHGGGMFPGIDTVVSEPASLFPCQGMIGLDFTVAKLESDRVVVMLLVVPDV